MTIAGIPTWGFDLAFVYNFKVCFGLFPLYLKYGYFFLFYMYLYNFIIIALKFTLCHLKEDNVFSCLWIFASRRNAPKGLELVHAHGGRRRGRAGVGGRARTRSSTGRPWAGSGSGVPGEFRL